jgi:galactose mutarotase-like enzyme
MSEHIIDNGQLRVCVSTYGAEMMSVQKNSEEFLWQGDTDYWVRRAPVMFPIIGNFPNDGYWLDGKIHHMVIHGFSKYSVYKVVEKEKDRILLRLDSNEQTRSQYPFNFHFDVGFALSGNTINVSFRVENCSGREMPVAFGSHHFGTGICPGLPALL